MKVVLIKIKGLPEEVNLFEMAKKFDEEDLIDIESDADDDVCKIKIIINDEIENYSVERKKLVAFLKSFKGKIKSKDWHYYIDDVTDYEIANIVKTDVF